MIYKLPFTAMTKALLKALKAEGNLEWFDSAVPIFEIEQYFQERAEFEYGIMGASTLKSDSNKDTVIWRGSLSLEIYSNYRGRKLIAEHLEHMLNYLSHDGFEVMQKSFADDGYALVSINIDDFSINMPIYGDNGIWQSGVTAINFVLQQGDE